MCGRFDLHLPRELLEEIFGISISYEIRRRYNIAPTQEIAAVRTNLDRERQLDFLKWGLIPSWAKDPSIGSRMINARSETVHEKPSFRTALKHRRCVIPANGFYEWEAVEGKKKPFYLKMKDDKPMLFAGLWDHWKPGDGEEILSCAILTTNSNDLITPLHDRMPVLLGISDIDFWLDPALDQPEHLTHLFQPFPSEEMEMYPVSDMVNSPKNDDPSCIERI